MSRLLFLAVILAACTRVETQTVYVSADVGADTSPVDTVGIVPDVAAEDVIVVLPDAGPPLLAVP